MAGANRSKPAPAAQPDFNEASIESGPGIRMTALDVAAETALLTLQVLGLEKSEWRRLLGGFGPVVDGAVLPRHWFDSEAPARAATPGRST